jgi:hypothetical protein
MLHRHHPDVGRETIRRRLHRGGMVARRPHPALEPDEEERRALLAESRQLLAELPDDETAVSQDEGEINLNPKVGSMGKFEGQQAEVQTPWTNRRRYLAGSIHRRTVQGWHEEVTQTDPSRPLKAWLEFIFARLGTGSPLKVEGSAHDVADRYTFPVVWVQDTAGVDAEARESAWRGARDIGPGNRGPGGMGRGVVEIAEQVLGLCLRAEDDGREDRVGYFLHQRTGPFLSVAGGWRP